MQKYSPSSYQAAVQTRKRGLLGNITDSLILGNGSVAGSIGRGISDTFNAKVTRIKEKFDPLNIARKLTGNIGAAVIGRAGGRSREDIENFAGRPPRNRNPRAQQYARFGPDIGELSKALYTKVSEGQIPKLQSGDSISNVLGKIYNLFLISNKADYDARENDKQNKKEEKELKEKQHKEILKALTGTGMAVPVKKEKEEEGNSFLGMIGDMIKGIISTITGMIASAIKEVKDFFAGILDFFKDGNVLKVLGQLVRAAGPLLALVGAGYVGYKFGEEFVKPLIDKMVQFSTGDKDATLGTAAYDKVEQFKKKFFGIETTEDKMNNQFFNDTINAATKNNNTIDEDVKNNLLSKDWVRNDPAKIAALNGFKVNPKQNISATEIQGSQLPAAGQGTYDIGNANYNSSTGVMTVPVKRRRMTTETAAPIPPEPSPIGARVLDATTNNNDAKLSESTTPRMISIDNSKKMAVGSSGPTIGMDSSVSVRIDDPTLQKIQKQGLRPV